MNYNITEQNATLILNMVKQGVSGYAIAKALSCSKASIQRFLQKRGIKTKHKCKVDYNNLLKNKTNQVIMLHKQGLSCGEIGKKLGHAQSRIYMLLKSLGYDTSSNKYIYSVDETFFQTIDTATKAYILGWFYSDGNVMNDGKLRICLHEKDKDVLEWIKQEMKYTGPLYNKPARNNSAPQVELCINRKVLVNQLIKLGCHPNKSMNLQCPSYKIVPKVLYNHFVRGYFDGDGSAANGVMIVGTLDFVTELKHKLPCTITNIYQRYKERKPEASSHQLFIGRKSEIKKIKDWMYQEATFYLERKKCVFSV